MNTTTECVFPLVRLTTERLELRAFLEADVDEVHRGAGDPSTQVWLPMPAPGHPYTRADARRWCLEQAPGARSSGDGQQWAVVERSGGAFVGSVGLTRTLWRSRTTEVGYWMAPWARGNGYAVEAVTAVAQWVLSTRGFQRLELKAAVGNVASRRVAEKVGFVHEGTERNAMPLHEGRTDLALYGLIPTDPAVARLSPPVSGTER